MKKIIAFILIFSTILGIAACNTNQPSESSDPENSSFESSSAAEESKIENPENPLIEKINSYFTGDVIDRSLSKTNIFADMEYSLSRATDTGYPDTGKLLTNGITAEIFDKQNWVGFSGYNEISIDFDLGENNQYAIGEITVGTLRQISYGIGMPGFVEVRVSDDGVNFTPVSVQFTPSDLSESDRYIYMFSFQKELKARYIQIYLSKSEKTFHFIDEICAYQFDGKGSGKTASPEDFYNYKLNLSDTALFPDSEDYNKIQNLALLPGTDIQIKEFETILESVLASNTDADQKFKLTDGKKASSTSFNDEALFKFCRGDGRHVVIDLGYLAGVSEWKIEFMESTGSGLACPEKVVVSLSENGTEWITASVSDYKNTGEKGTKIIELTEKFDNKYKARYVRFSFVTDNGAYDISEHYVNVFITEIEVYGTKDTSGAVTAVPMKGLNGSFGSAGQLNGEKNILFLTIGDIGTDSLDYETALNMLAYYDSNGKIIDTYMDGMVMAKSSSLSPKMKTLADYDKYFDIIFNEKYNLSMLDKAQGEVIKALGTDKLPVYFSIFTIKQDGTVFGNVNGTEIKVDSVENREKIVRFIMDKYIQAFESKGYQNIYFAGFYWEQEAVSNITPEYDMNLIEKFNEYAHEMDYKTIWVPYFGANYYYRWQELGFDFASLQPNYSFANVKNSRLYSTAWLAWVHGMGVELEIEDYKSQAATDKYKDYLRVGAETGYINGIKFYYQGGIPGAIFASKNDDLFGIYKDTYMFASGKMDVDYYNEEAVDFGNTKDNYDLEVISGEKLTHDFNEFTAFEPVISISPLYGSIKFERSGMLTYVPLENYTGSDLIELKLKNSKGEFKTVTINIKVS